MNLYQNKIGGVMIQHSLGTFPFDESLYENVYKPVINKFNNLNKKELIEIQMPPIEMIGRTYINGEYCRFIISCDYFTKDMHFTFRDEINIYKRIYDDYIKYNVQLNKFIEE